MKKQTVIFTLFITVISLFASMQKSYAYMGNTKNDKSSMIDSLVTRFNLNKNDVVTFFNEKRQQNQQNRLDQLKSKLNDLVTSKTITEAQKNELLELVSEHQTELLKIDIADKDKLMQVKNEHRAKMQEFATKYNLSIKDLGIGFGKRQGGVNR